MPSEFIIIPDQMTSVRDAVNVLIASLGESPVATIDPSPSVDVDNALIALNMANLTVQSKGWTWNRERDYPLTIGVDGRVSLPAGTLRVTAAYYTPGSVADVVQRGDYLYDKGNRRYTFTTAPRVDMIMRLPWEYMPQIARAYITLVACQSFHAALQERGILLQVTQAMSDMALVTLEQYEDEVGKLNSVSDNVSVTSALGGLSGLRRNRQGF